MKGSLAMKRVAPQEMTVEQLAEQFAAITLDQDRAIRTDDNAKYNRLFRQMRVVEETLKGRPGDQRRALIQFYDHANAQVRLAAAKATLAVAPDAARRLLRAIADSNDNPQIGDAGMCLVALDRGIFKPT
jgi:cytochrome c oxidase assembly protein Cox11